MTTEKGKARAETRAKMIDETRRRELDKAAERGRDVIGSALENMSTATLGIAIESLELWGSKYVGIFGKWPDFVEVIDFLKTINSKIAGPSSLFDIKYSRDEGKGLRAEHKEKTREVMPGVFATPLDEGGSTDGGA